MDDKFNKSMRFFASCRMVPLHWIAICHPERSEGSNFLMFF